MSMPLRRLRAQALSAIGPDNPFMAEHQAFIRAFSWLLFPPIVQVVA